MSVLYAQPPAPLPFDANDAHVRKRDASTDDVDDGSASGNGTGTGTDYGKVPGGGADTPSAGFGSGSGSGAESGSSPTLGTTDKLAYNDDAADVRLKSTDGRVFKVHSYLLKAHSPHFRDLLAKDPPTGPIPISLGTKHLKLLLDLMHLKPAPAPAIWAYRVPLLAACDALALKGVAERIVFALGESVERDPWAVFVIAAQRGSVGLARAALRALEGQEGTFGLDGLRGRDVEGVPVGWVLGLMRAVMRTAGEEGAGWKAIAEGLAPVSY